jgi:hypothetical protein
MIRWPIWLNFAELFDVDVDQVAGMLALVASHRRPAQAR